MNIDRTRDFYIQIKEEELCDCTYCRNYVSEIKKA